MSEVDPKVVGRLMRRQAKLGLSVAAVFILLLIGLPLLNLYMPEAMAVRVMGFTFTWLFLAVLFYPITWALSWLFVRKTEQIEHEQAEEMRAEGSAK
jgi:uncharacterized membrane protein (DUF485 family)